MTPDADLYRRAAARCITRAPHIDADQLPPCNACLLAIAASPSAGGTPTVTGAGLAGVSGQAPAWSPNPSQAGDSTSQAKGGTE